MTERLITRAPIIRARRVDRIAISTPGDFVTGKSQRIAGDGIEPLLPYCLDIVRRRSLYVGGVDTAAAQAAPFYYLHLRCTARTLVSVPWEIGALHGTSRAPVFLFSPGRCGSTLLSRILSAAGAANVSEPDFYTQLTTAAAASRFNPWRGAMTTAAAGMGSDLAAALDPMQPLIVKLRAESCRAPSLLLRPQERRTIFMTRGFAAWARSNIRAFRNPPGKTVNKYMQALTAYAWLKRNRACHLIRYEDLLADPAAATASLGGFLGHTIAADIAETVMKEDSQEGTPLEQGARPDLPGWERRFAATMALWNSARLKNVRTRLDVSETEAG